MASNGKKRISAQEVDREKQQERRLRIKALKKAVAAGTYSIHKEDIVLNVLREVLQP